MVLLKKRFFAIGTRNPHLKKHQRGFPSKSFYSKEHRKKASFRYCLSGIAKIGKKKRSDNSRMRKCHPAGLHRLNMEEINRCGG